MDVPSSSSSSFPCEGPSQATLPQKKRMIHELSEDHNSIAEDNSGLVEHHLLTTAAQASSPHAIKSLTSITFPVSSSPSSSCSAPLSLSGGLGSPRRKKSRASSSASAVSTSASSTSVRRRSRDRPSSSSASSTSFGVASSAGLYPKRSQSVPPFLLKTYEIVNKAIYDKTIAWTNNGRCIMIFDVDALTEEILPKYFKVCIASLVN